MSWDDADEIEYQKTLARRTAEAPLAARTGSVAKCEWWTGDKKSGFTTCQDAAAWQHVILRRGAERIWKLCEHHKTLLLESYNPTWRAKEEPEWTPVLPLNGELSDRTPKT